METNRAAEKSSTYFALLGALRQSGCAVCRLLHERSTAYLETLLYEQVTDVRTRRKLRQARGLCTRHSWEVRTIKMAPLGIAIIAQDLLDEELTRLGELQRHGFGHLIVKPLLGRIRSRVVLAFIRDWHQREMCPACQVAVEHEKHILGTLLTFWSEGDLAQRFEASDGICLPHVARLIEQYAPHPALHAFVEAQRRTYEGLIAELAEFRRKHDYRFTDAAWGAESDVWLRALETLAGKSEVFGTDLRREVRARGPQRWWQHVLNHLSTLWHGS